MIVDNLKDGGLAQLGERLNGIQKVEGSTPLPSTIFFVYVLQSLSTGKFYIGQCDHLIERFREHQAGYTTSTRGRGPWWVPYFEWYPTRSAAMRRERQLKRLKSHTRIRSLISTLYPNVDLR